MIVTLWYVIIGVLLISMALAGSVLKRLPLSSAVLYLVVGAILGETGAGLITIDPLSHTALLERLTEVAVIISLFSTGLQLRTPLTHGRWELSVRLATVSMLLTVALIAAAGTFGLGLPLGAAILLGAILAPTDPVLASDVQVDHPDDRDQVRFSLTGEAGLNDGIAFPFVMLGLGLLGLHDLGALGWRWLAVDLLWAVTAGIVIGGVLGTVVGKVVLYLRREHKEGVGLDDFLALGLIALSYGLALLVHAYGFLAVFAAGLALRRVEVQSTGEQPPPEVRAAASMASAGDEIATDPEKAPTYMAQAVLGFNQQLERIGEVTVVLLVGVMLTVTHLPIDAIWFILVLFFVVRPLSVLVGLSGTGITGMQQALIAWFGIRGIGSIYYLAFAIVHGLPPDLAQQLIALTLVTVAASIAVHGVSVTPIMKRYTEQRVSVQVGSSDSKRV